MSSIALIIAASLSQQVAAYSPVPVFGAERQPQFDEGLAAAPARSFYIGGYASADVRGPYVVHFYAVDDPALPRHEGEPYASIPWARRSADHRDGGTDVQWADGRACPGLYGVLTEFTLLQGPSFSTPPLQRQPTGAGSMSGEMPPIHGGATMALWGYARQGDGAPASMSLTAASGRLIAWRDFSEARLSDCWTSASPRVQD